MSRTATLVFMVFVSGLEKRRSDAIRGGNALDVRRLLLGNTKLDMMLRDSRSWRDGGGFVVVEHSDGGLELFSRLIASPRVQVALAEIVYISFGFLVFRLLPCTRCASNGLFKSKFNVFSCLYFTFFIPQSCRILARASSHVE